MSARKKNITRLDREKSGLSKEHWSMLARLNSPAKIQDYLNNLPFNFQHRRQTYWPVSRSLREGKIHCVEGALLAAAALWIHGHKPLLLDLRTTDEDVDHVVALFKQSGKWGAISKTNHSVLRYREPIYRDVRELAMSYFHEYFLNNGTKTLRKYSQPFDLSKDGLEWISGKNNLFELIDRLDRSKHFDILSPTQLLTLRKADKIEIEAGKIEEWPKR